MKAISDNIQERIQDALGLHAAIEIHIDLAVGDITTVRVVYYPNTEEVEKLIPILQEYELVPKSNKKRGEAR